MSRQSRPRVIVTRPADQGAAFAARLADALPQAEVIVAPLMAVQVLRPVLPAGAFAAVIFTSGNAVRAVAGMDLPRRAYCVGAQTARAAAAAGFDAVSADGDAQALLALIATQPPGGPLLHLHGAETRGDVAARLTAAGIPAQGLVVYRQNAQPLSPQALGALAGDAPVILPVFSPRSAALLVAAVGQPRAPLFAAAISPAAAAPLRDLPLIRLEIAESPDAAAMVAAVGRLLQAAGRLE